MKHSLQRIAAPGSLFLIASALFAACGGLDPRIITRGPDQAVGGDTTTEGGSGGPTPSSGGSEATAGGAPAVVTPGNPFGGDTFSGGAPPVVDGPPEVVKVDPADGADDGDPDGNVSLLFSEGLDETTVTGDNIKIMDGSTELAGELSYAGVVATFAPNDRLSLLASYDVSVSQGVTDTGGQKLKDKFASKFTVRDGVWGKQLSAFTEQDLWGFDQDAGIDAQGNTLVVWTQRVSTTDSNRRVQARWYRANKGWQPVVTLEAIDSDCMSPRVAVSPEGDAAVAWLCSDAAGNLRAFARRFVGGDWEPSALDVAPQSSYVFNSNWNLPPVVAIGGGQVVVSWINTQYESSTPDYYFTPQVTSTSLAGAWPDYSRSIGFGNYYANYTVPFTGLSVTVDAKGNAIFAYGFQATTATDSGVYYARKAATSSWQSADKITNSTLPNGGPTVVSDGDGAMAVWIAYDSMTNEYHVVASRYTKAKQFAAPVPIGDPDLLEYAGMTGHNLASDGKSFFATWGQTVGTSANAYATRYDIATGKWDALPTVVSDGVASAGGVTSIGLDGHGNALVAYNQIGVNNGRLVMYARYTASNGKWQAPDVLAEDGHNYDSPVLGVAQNGISSVLFFANGSREGTGATETAGGQFRIFK